MSLQEGDEEKIKHRIPHRFETFTNIGANWCCHCGYMLPLGRKNAKKCSECGITCHATCTHFVPDFCGLSMEQANTLLANIRDIKSIQTASRTISKVPAHRTGQSQSQNYYEPEPKPIGMGMGMAPGGQLEQAGYPGPGPYPGPPSPPRQQAQTPQSMYGPDPRYPQSQMPPQPGMPYGQPSGPPPAPRPQPSIPGQQPYNQPPYAPNLPQRPGPPPGAYDPQQTSPQAVSHSKVMRKDQY
jgi:novel protein kinase C epsilon type